MAVFETSRSAGSGSDKSTLSLHVRQPCMNLEKLKTRQLDFNAVHSNKKNIVTRQLHSFLGNCRAANFIYLDTRQSDFTAVHGIDGNLDTGQLHSFLGHCGYSLLFTLMHGSN